MAGRNINLFYGDVTYSGNVAIPEATLTITAEWTAADGTPKTDTRTVTRTQILAQLTVAQKRRLDAMMMIAAVRFIVGIDDEVMA